MASRDHQGKVNPGAGRPSIPGIVFGEKKFGTAGGPACPKCGGQMVLRTSWGARIGTSFWGCSRYPRCCSTITTS
ncbi:MAG: topoisomerase DNA-binding C4 zinc finger domain-containing protein [Nitrospirota bacterium]